jgi:hypothetical protein
VTGRHAATWSPPELVDAVRTHGVGAATDLPLPLDLVLQAAAFVVLASFAAVLLLWRRPQFTGASSGAVLPTTVSGMLGSRVLRRLVQWLVLVLSVALVLTAFVGPRSAAANPAPYALYVWLWVGLVPVSLLAGPVWRVVNPLRLVHGVLCRVLRLPRQGLRPAAGRAAGRAEYRPATVALLVFIWFELVAPGSAEPLAVGGFLVGYAVVQVGCAVVWGHGWFARGDCFEVYSELIGRLAPIGRDADGHLRGRNPFNGLAGTPPGPGLAAFVSVWWGSTVFDSVTGAPRWAELVQRTSVPVLLGTTGLVVVCVAVLTSLVLVVRHLDVTATLIPIAVGYTVAHYASLLVVEGRTGVVVLAQAWGWGADWSASRPLAPAVVTAVQLTAVLAGHVCGVVAAHDRTVSGEDRPLASRIADELPMVLLMVGYTVTGLALLFAA